MAEIPSRLDLYNIGRRYVLTRAKEINPREVDVEGSDINLFVGAASFMAAAVVQHNAERINALLLDGNFGEDLDRYGIDRYGTPRKGASAALATVQFSRTSNAAGPGSIPANTKLTTLTGIEYITLTTANFTAAGPSSLAASATVRAAQAGKAFQVGANNIRRFDRPSQIFDPTISVNNTEPASGGEEAESDDVYKERLRMFWNAARRGTLGAIEFGALLTPGVVSAKAVEVLGEDNRPTRFVELYIADSSGVSSQALANAVDQQLFDYRGAGIFVAVNTSRPQIVDVVFQPTFVAGVDTVGLSEQIRGAILAYINSLRVNEPLLISDLGAVLARFRPDGLLPRQTSLLEPLGDLFPGSGFTLRTRPENIQVITPITTTA